MTNTKWTPGPWSYIIDYQCRVQKSDGEIRSVIAILPENLLADEHGGDCWANARLIAAAPEMAECLKMLLDAIDGNHLTVGDCNEARHILARIRGDA